MRRLSRLIFVSIFGFLACGAELLAETPLPAGAGYEVGFSPGGGAQAEVLKVINSAQHSLKMAAYELTSRPIGSALIEARIRGVNVQIILDAKASKSKYSLGKKLIAAGLSVRKDSRYSIFHHKFIVVDDRTVETGSFNYTHAADHSNAENALVLWNVPQLARQFLQEWQRAWDESQARSSQ